MTGKALFANVAVSTLQTAVTAASTTLVIAAGDGALFPVPATIAGLTSYFEAVIEDRAVYPVVREIVRVTNNSNNQFTVVRGITPAFAFPAGATVSNRVTASAIAAMRDEAIAAQRMLGNFAEPPDVRNDGSTLQTGDSYYDTTMTTRFVYIGGNTWIAENRPQGNFTVGGNLDIGGNTTVGGNFTVLDNETIGGNLTVEGAASIVGDAVIDGSVTILGAESLGGDLIVAGSLTVKGNSSQAGNVSIGGAVSVASNMNVGGTLDVGALTIGGKIVATLDEVSGDDNMQTFPDGNIIKWGADNTGTGTIRVVFRNPYPNRVISIVATPAGLGAGAFSLIISVQDDLGFTVTSYNNRNVIVPSLGFFWFAIGL